MGSSRPLVWSKIWRNGTRSTSLDGCTSRYANASPGLLRTLSSYLVPSSLCQVLSLLSTPQIDNAVRTNLTSAMSTSLLLLPRSFAEEDLLVKIAGLSYSGDPRMSVPGAENPEKVKNIVRGPGSLLGFRHLYKEVLSDVGVEHNQEKKSQDVWMIVSPSPLLFFIH